MPHVFSLLVFKTAHRKACDVERFSTLDQCPSLQGKNGEH